MISRAVQLSGNAGQEATIRARNDKVNNIMFYNKLPSLPDFEGKQLWQDALRRLLHSGTETSDPQQRCQYFPNTCT